jgi:hypothetical protein
LVPPALRAVIERGDYTWPPKGMIPFGWFLTKAYSTDWDAVQEVVKALHRRGWEVHLTYRPDGHWICDLEIGLYKGWTEGGETLPLAVCRAALGALTSADVGGVG